MHQIELTSATSVTTSSSQESMDWSKAFNTSILSTVLDSIAPESELQTLVNSPEFQFILAAAQNLSSQLQITPEEATERLIKTFRGIDSCWNKILVKRGAESLMGL